MASRKKPARTKKTTSSYIDSALHERMQLLRARETGGETTANYGRGKWSIGNLAARLIREGLQLSKVMGMANTPVAFDKQISFALDVELLNEIGAEARRNNTTIKVMINRYIALALAKHGV